MYINRIDSNTKDDKRFTCSPTLFKNYDYSSISHEKRAELNIKHKIVWTDILFLERILTKTGNPIGSLRDAGDYEKYVGKIDDCIKTFFMKHSLTVRYYKMITNDNTTKKYMKYNYTCEYAETCVYLANDIIVELLTQQTQKEYHTYLLLQHINTNGISCITDIINIIAATFIDLYFYTQ